MLKVFGYATPGWFSIALGILLLVNWRPALVAEAMIVLLIIFSIASLMLPHEYWLTPFAPVLKNLPLAVALLTLIGMEKPRRPAAHGLALATPAPARALPVA